MSKKMGGYYDREEENPEEEFCLDCRLEFEHDHCKKCNSTRRGGGPPVVPCEGCGEKFCRKCLVPTKTHDALCEDCFKSSDTAKAKTIFDLPIPESEKEEECTSP